MGYSHGIKWTDDMIKEQVLRVINVLEIDRMPSRNEVVDFYGNCRLSIAIARRNGGWYQLAKDLNLKIKNCETSTGKKYEKIVAGILKGKDYKVEMMSQNFSYDLLVNDYVKIDVKVSHFHKSNNGNFHSFNIGKKFATCDIYILVSLDDLDKIKDFYIVPSTFVFNNQQISIGEYESKYHQFKNRWDILDNFSKFYRKENEKWN